MNIPDPQQKNYEEYEYGLSRKKFELLIKMIELAKEHNSIQTPSKSAIKIEKVLENLPIHQLEKCFKKLQTPSKSEIDDIDSNNALKVLMSNAREKHRAEIKSNEKKNC